MNPRALVLAFTIIASSAFAQSDADAINAAQTLLKDSAKAYAEARALTDTVKLEMKGPMGEQTQEMLVKAQGSDAVLRLADMTVTVVGKAMYVERAGVDDKYAEFEVSGGDLASTLESVIGFAPPQLVARTAADDVDRLLNAWSYGMIMSPAMTGHALKPVGGVEMHEIALKGQAGDGTMLINPKTKLVEKIALHITPPGAPEGSDMTATLTFSPKISETLEPAIAFEPGTRTKVTELAALRIDLAGKPAPDFTLTALDGASVTLSELKGSIVVIDFWAMWCGPCKLGLPKLQEFADWVKKESRPVKVFAVDVWERQPRDAVAEFWKSNGYTIPVLLDEKSETPGKYGFDSIPFTVIVDAKGVVHSTHSGYRPDMAEELQKAVQEILDRAQE
jgi:thiol-disulfide isomerase/thioredoxin